MKRNKTLINFCLIMLVALIGVSQISAQTETKQIKPAYMIYTYTVVGSNQNNANGKPPAEISGVVNELKGNYAYSNYRMLATHFQSIGSDGGVNYNAILKNFSSLENQESPIYASWIYDRFQADSDSNGKSFVGFRNFNFKLNVPVSFSPIVSYQPISISLNDVRVPADKPTVFASLPVDLTNETVFFVIKVKEVK